MTKNTMLQGHILTPRGWVKGEIQFQQKINAIHGQVTDCFSTPELQNEHYILPGFVDLHVHGGGGADAMEAGSDDRPIIETITRKHAQTGTTSLLITTMTAPRTDIERALKAIAPYCGHRTSQAAHVLGVHLEGPYISPEKLGAQPPNAVEAHWEEIQYYNSLAPIKVMTLAPEINHHAHLSIFQQLTSQGIRAQIGHTTGGYATGVAALAHGAAGFTHLYNAMSGLQHRDPGMVGAALAHAQYAELISDLLHVDKGAMLAALRAIPYAYAITDGTAASGMPDGEYKLGSQTVIKRDGAVRLRDGESLAGSCLTMDQALRNLVSIGLTLADASHRVSAYPARYLQLADRGQLAVGAFADLVVLDRDLNIKQVIAEGEEVLAN